ncbi:GNAT family N-acetyltransferase [Pseudomonadota bacterium]
MKIYGVSGAIKPNKNTTKQMAEGNISSFSLIQPGAEQVCVDTRRQILTDTVFMPKVIELKTERLILRQWKKSDFQPFANMSADPAVMEYYPSTLNVAESNAMASRIKDLLSEHGWGFWAVETLDTSQFIGFVGLNSPSYDLPVTPCVEIGWRLNKASWGKGYATEAANEALKFAFDELDLNEVYSFSSVSNRKSWRVMQRLGMFDTYKNFEHPIIPEGHALREHVLYKITKEHWEKGERVGNE